MVVVGRSTRNHSAVVLAASLPVYSKLNHVHRRKLAFFLLWQHAQSARYCCHRPSQFKSWCQRTEPLKIIWYRLNTLSKLEHILEIAYWPVDWY